MYAIYICFSSWSKRSELGKESEEDKVKLLDMCSVTEANKELIRHEVRVSDEQTYVRDLRHLETVDQFCFLSLASKLPPTQRSFCFSYL